MIRISRKGFVLVYAVFLSGILLTIGVGALGLVLRGFQLSTTSRDSQLAFFAADSVIECAMYWEQRYFDHGLTNSPFAYEDSISLPDDAVTCNGRTIWTSPSSIERNYNYETQPCNLTNFDNTSVEFPYEVVEDGPEGRVVSFDMHFENGAYAVGTVGRTADLAESDIHTAIAACGFNYANPDNPRRVERGIDFQF